MFFSLTFFWKLEVHGIMLYLFTTIYWKEHFIKISHGQTYEFRVWMTELCFTEIFSQLLKNLFLKIKFNLESNYLLDNAKLNWWCVNIHVLNARHLYCLTLHIYVVWKVCMFMCSHTTPSTGSHVFFWKQINTNPCKLMVQFSSVAQ